MCFKTSNEQFTKVDSLDQFSFLLKMQKTFFCTVVNTWFHDPFIQNVINLLNLPFTVCEIEPTLCIIETVRVFWTTNESIKYCVNFIFLWPMGIVVLYSLEWNGLELKLQFWNFINIQFCLESELVDGHVSASWRNFNTEFMERFKDIRVRLSLIRCQIYLLFLYLSLVQETLFENAVLWPIYLNSVLV